MLLLECLSMFLTSMMTSVESPCLMLFGFADTDSLTLPFALEPDGSMYIATMAAMRIMMITAATPKTAVQRTRFASLSICSILTAY